MSPIRDVIHQLLQSLGNRKVNVFEKDLLRVLGSLALCSLVALTPAPTPARTFTFINKCTETIWLAAPDISPGGWQLDVQPSKGCKSNTDCTNPQTCDTSLNQCQFPLPVPDTFSGRFWPRTGCNFNSDGTCPLVNNGPANCCATGGCTIPGGWGLECQSGGQSPVTVAEITLSQKSTDNDFYDVSVIDGFNVPVEVQPTGGSTCPSTFKDCDYWCGNPGGPTSTTNLAGCTWNQVLDSACDKNSPKNSALRVVAPSSCTKDSECTSPSTCNLGTNVCQCTSDSDCASGEICGVGNNQIIGYKACGKFVGCTTPKALCGVYFSYGASGPISPAVPFSCFNEYPRTVSCTKDAECPQLIGIDCTSDSDCPTTFAINTVTGGAALQPMECIPGAPDRTGKPTPGKCQQPCIGGYCEGAHCKSDSDCVFRGKNIFMGCDKSWLSPTSQTCVSTNASLFECTGVNGSCYTTANTDTHTPRASSLCAGCPTAISDPSPWPTSPTICANNNSDWVSNIQPWLVSFKKACPTAYSFPFDDPTSTFQCRSDGALNSVNYTITFCPK